MPIFSRKITGLKPLSVNKAWRGGQRFKTVDYEDYKEDLKYLLNAKKTIKGYIGLDIRIGLKSSVYKRSDVDNFLKPMLDSLVDAGLIEDDRLVKKISVEKYIADDYEITINII